MRVIVGHIFIQTGLGFSDIAIEKLYGMLHHAGGIDPGRDDIAGGIIHQTNDIGLPNSLNPEGTFDVGVPEEIGAFSAIAVGQGGQVLQY